MRLVYIEWLDSAGLPGWQSVEKVGDFAAKVDCMCISVGLVVAESEDVIVIAQSVSSEGIILNPTAIPQRSILEIRDVE